MNRLRGGEGVKRKLQAKVSRAKGGVAPFSFSQRLCAARFRSQFSFQPIPTAEPIHRLSPYACLHQTI